MRAIFVFILVVFSFGNFRAQHKTHFCGTKTPTNLAQKSLLMATPDHSSCNYIKRVNRTLQISLHICYDQFGSTNIEQDDIDGALERLNLDFKPCGLQFQYCLVQYMLDDRFDSLTVTDAYDEEIQMTSIYYEPNTINVYLVDTIGVDGGADVNGYANFPGADKDLMVIEKQAFEFDSQTFTHEMGHFFGLYHTFETDNGLELVNGSNCEIAGDLVCDTFSDPDPDGNSDPDDHCNYTGNVLVDANGDWYVPPTDNYMSYYSSDCRCRFTPQQYNRMIDQYLNNRNHLW